MTEECAECGASFASAADLIEHMKTPHAPETAPSETPNARESSEGPLGTGAQRAQPFVCGTCGATFATREALAAHNLSSTHEKVDRDDRDATRDASPLL
jgi:hypothetical protein